MKYRLYVFLILLLTSSYLPAEWTTIEQISLLKAQGNGMYFEIENFTSSDSVFNCGSRGFWLPITEGNYDARVSMLLAAYMAKTNIKVGYNSCSAGVNAAGSIILE